jgi:aldose 1-epimerase
MARALVFLALMCLVAPSLAGGTEAKKMVGVYVLKKGNFSVKMTNWGATVMSIILPDSKGTMNKLCFFFFIRTNYVSTLRKSCGL